jgi:hypothetical protein
MSVFLSGDGWLAMRATWTSHHTCIEQPANFRHSESEDLSEDLLRVLAENWRRLRR